MMRVLVTGAGGFVGGYLRRELEAHGHQVVAAAADITDAQALGDEVKMARADACVHLAAVTHVVEATKDPARASAVNVVGTHNLLSALAQYGKGSLPFLHVSTSLVYGDGFFGRTVIAETTAPAPTSAYACTKLASEYVVRAFDGRGLDTYVARPFNHIGPGQSREFVCSAFAHRIVEAKGAIDIGNLSSKRDFTDVRDIVRAYRLILEKRPAERTFVLGSGEGVAIQHVLDRFIAFANKAVATKVNPDLIRPDEAFELVADASLARRALQWRPEIPLEQTLREIYQEAAAKHALKDSDR